MLIEIVDVTDEVNDLFTETSNEIDEALGLLQDNEIDQDGCDCIYATRSNHCDTFKKFNPNVPTLSVYNIPRVRAEKIEEFVEEGIYDLADVTEDMITANQVPYLKAVQSGKPFIDLKQIRKFMKNLKFPLYFIDYETYASAIPLIDGSSPHKHFPVQYSLHFLKANGKLEHRDYLEREEQLPDQLIAKMKADIGTKGSIISWHASFEETQNNTMKELFPDAANFLQGVNDRMVDLEELFKTGYVDARFGGSTSIKKVLPVLCPKLSYEDLDVKDGTGAMLAWRELISSQSGEADELANSLLEYCKLDTLAMVEIYRFLKKLL